MNSNFFKFTYISIKICQHLFRFKEQITSLFVKKIFFEDILNFAVVICQKTSFSYWLMDGWRIGLAEFGDKKTGHLLDARVLNYYRTGVWRGRGDLEKRNPGGRADSRHEPGKCSNFSIQTRNYYGIGFNRFLAGSRECIVGIFSGCSSE